MSDRTVNNASFPTFVYRYGLSGARKNYCWLKDSYKVCLFLCMLVMWLVMCTTFFFRAMNTRATVSRARSAAL